MFHKSNEGVSTDVCSVILSLALPVFHEPKWKEPKLKRYHTTQDKTTCPFRTLTIADGFALQNGCARCLPFAPLKFHYFQRVTLFFCFKYFLFIVTNMRLCKSLAILVIVVLVKLPTQAEGKLRLFLASVYIRFLRFVIYFD